MGYRTNSHVTEGAELGRHDPGQTGLRDPYEQICVNVLRSARDKDYNGYSKFDALNSPFLRTLSMDNKWLRLFFTQLVNRSPFHIRPLLGVQRSRNPKGIALFIRAYLFLYTVTGTDDYRREAENLLEWLAENRAPRSKHASWGYNFIWQNTMFVQDAHEPNCVVSVYGGEAFIHAFRLLQDPKYLQMARDVADFIMEELPVLFSSEDEMAIGYVMGEVNSVVLNINALAGAFLAKVWAHTREPELAQCSEKLIRHTVNRRTPYHAWYYSYPKDKSPIRHDNYHTGMILDALMEYSEERQDEQFMDVYWKGLDYYRNNLFEPDGAPRWMNDKRYPLDVHGAAQGIITFSKAAGQEPGFISTARKIADWALGNLYRRRTCDFAYRKGRFMTWDYSLMRWCNAWMAKALAEMISTR